MWADGRATDVRAPARVIEERDEHGGDPRGDRAAARGYEIHPLPGPHGWALVDAAGELVLVATLAGEARTTAGDWRWTVTREHLAWRLVVRREGDGQGTGRTSARPIGHVDLGSQLPGDPTRSACLIAALLCIRFDAAYPDVSVPSTP